MNRRQFAFWGALLPFVLIQGCATQPPPQPVPTIDFLANLGKTVTVTDRIVHFRLPAPGGQLSIWSPAELRWYEGQVNGTLGRIVIGRAHDDFGIPYLVRYTVGGKVYEVTVVKTRVATEYKSVHTGQYVYLYREEEGYEPGMTGWCRTLGNTQWFFSAEHDDWV